MISRQAPDAPVLAEEPRPPKQRKPIAVWVIGGLAVFWLLFGLAGGSFTGKLTEVQKNDNAAYLPASAESTQAGNEAAKFSASQIQAALQVKYGSDLLFPVYDSLDGTGANAPYHIIGWAAFHVTLAQSSGNNGTISGWFDHVIWQGIVPTNGPANTPDLGVHSVALVD